MTTLTQRRWAAVGTLLALTAVVSTLILLIQYAPAEIRERRYAEGRNGDGRTTVIAVSSTVTILFLTATLLLYLRLAHRWARIVKDPTLPDVDHRITVSIIVLNFATLMAAFIVNLSTFGLSVSPLRGLVYAYGFLILGSLSLGLVGGLIVILVQGVIWLGPQLYLLARAVGRKVPILLRNLFSLGPRLCTLIGDGFRSFGQYIKVFSTVWCRSDELLPAGNADSAV